MPMEHDPALPGPDEFDRQLRDITSGKADPAKFTELSAAERARQAERAKRAARPTTPPRVSWRGARKAKKPRRPVSEPGHGNADPTRIGPQARRKRTPAGSGRPRLPGQRPRLRDRPGMRTTAVLAAFVLLLYVLHVLGFGPQWPSFGGSGPASPAATPTPPPSPRHAAVPAFTVSDPFADSQAEQFANGAAGIVPPAAHHVRGYSTRQVAAAYAATKRLLVAGNLDRLTLAGGFPVAFARLLSPALQLYFVRNLGRTGVSSSGAARSTRTWVASFAPRTTALVGSVIRVHGYMLAMAATDRARRVLRVHVDYLFVYPVQRPALPATRIRVVVQIIGDADFARWNDPGGPLQIWWLPARAATAGVRCDVHDGFIHPNFPGTSQDGSRDGSRGGSQPTGTRIDPYRLNPPAENAGCHATGT